MALSTEYAEQLAIHEENRDEPIVYFVLPCYNEAEGLRHTAEVLHHKFDLLVASKKMISFAIQGITSFSTKPLSFVTGVAGIIGLGRNRHIRLCHGVINGGACDGRMGVTDVFDMAYRWLHYDFIGHCWRMCR